MTSAHLSFDQTSEKLARRVTKMRASAVRDLFAAASRPDIISLSGGMPDVSLLDPAILEKLVASAFKQDRVAALQYGDTAGRESCRRALCKVMRDSGIRSKPEDLIITSGAQEALDLIAKTFINPGDTIITEGPTYLGALQAFSAYEPKIETIPFDNQGIRTDLLEDFLSTQKQGAVKFLYTIPNFQNPGGVTMSSERRDKLLELSHKYNFLVIEDDPYGRLRYDGGHVLPLRARDPRVVYLGTVSKVFAPGLRTGWILAPSDVLARINLVKQGADLCGSTFNQVLVEHYFEDTAWEHNLQNFIKTYRERRDAMLSALEEFFPPEASWTAPEGGFFVWVTLPEYVDTSAMIGDALEKGVIYTPGDGFFPDGKLGKNCMRIAFCYESPEKIREACARLALVIEEKLELYRAFLEAGALKPTSLL